MTDPITAEAPKPSPVAGEDALKGLVALINDVLATPLKPGSALHAITQAAFNGAIGEVHRALQDGYTAKCQRDNPVKPVEAEKIAVEAATAG